MKYGRFQIELNSNYNYRTGTIVKIDGVRYDVVKKIIEAVSPILEDEVNMIKIEVKEREMSS